MGIYLLGGGSRRRFIREIDRYFKVFCLVREF